MEARGKFDRYLATSRCIYFELYALGRISEQIPNTRMYRSRLNEIYLFEHSIPNSETRLLLVSEKPTKLVTFEQ